MTSLVVVLACGVALLGVLRWRASGMPAGRRWRDALAPALPLLLVPGLLIGSWQLQQTPRVLRASVDLTSQERNSLSDRTAQVFSDLRREARDVELVVFVPENAPEYRPLTILLGKYDQLGANVRQVDPNKEPSEAREFGVQALGDIFAVSEGRSARAESASELGITTAVVQASVGRRTVCWVQGHGELPLSDPILKLALDGLNRNGFDVRPVRLGAALKALDGCAIVAVVSPRGRPIGPEAEIWKRLTESSGRSLLLLDPDTISPEAADGWLAPLALQASAKRVEDPAGSLIYDPQALVIERFPSTSVITDGLPALVFLGTSGFDITAVQEAENFTLTVLATGGSGSTAGPIKEPAVAAMVDRSQVEGNGDAAKIERARTLVVGDADWINNETLTLGGNEQFLLRGLRVLSEPDPVVAVGSPAITNLLVITPRDVRQVNLVMFGVPSALVLAAAALVMLRRRRRGYS